MRRTRITAPIGAALVALAVAVPIALDSAEAGKSRVLAAAQESLEGDGTPVALG
jgi:hypothetical protein